MSPTKTEKAFDCVAAKRETQERIYEETRDMTHAELLAYLKRSVEQGPFAEWWRAVQASTLPGSPQGP